MSTMGIVYGGGAAEREQLMLLRTLQDNERNINRAQVVLPKNNVSVINVNTSVNQQQQQQSENNPRTQQNQQQQQQQLPPYDPSRLKKHGKNGQPPPIAVAKRNARERNRVKQVNNGFATLRQHIPSHVAQGYGDRGKKLSKVETLRMAVEYIRGLQRLLAEADGLEYNENAGQSADNNVSIMIPSPTNSAYSGSTHNGSADVLGLDEHHSAGNEQELDASDAYHLMDEEDELDDERDSRKDAKRFREDSTPQSRLSENQNRGSNARRRRASPTTTYYVSRQSFGDEENIEPLSSRNNNNNSSNNNNLLNGFSPILLQNGSPTSLPQIKREIHLLDDEESAGRREAEVVLAASSPYAGEILIENPETGRLVPLKLEDQLVYVTETGQVNNAGAYYKHELEAASTTEFMDVVSWWEQEQQGRHHFGNQPAAQQRLAHV